MERHQKWPIAFFVFVSATKLNKSLFLFQHSVVNDDEKRPLAMVDIIFADDSTLLSDQAYQKCVRVLYSKIWVGNG